MTSVVVVTRAEAGQTESTLVGRGQGSGAGATQEITVGSGLVMTGTTLSATGGGGPASQLDANGTTLDVDAIADGQYLRRVGTTVVGATISGGGDASFLSGVITTTANSSNTVYSAITGSNVTVEAGKTYAISWRLRTYSALSTTGPRPRRVLGGGAAGTVAAFHYIGMSGVTAAMLQSSREGTNDPFLATGNATSTTTAAGSLWIDCLFICTTGGTLGLEFVSEVNASAATIDGDGSAWYAVVRTT